MTTGTLIALDIVIAVLGAAGWLGGGAASAARRRPLAQGLTAVALVATLARGVTIVALARAGWWFAAEKVLIAAPLTLAAAVPAAVVAGPRLLRARGDVRSAALALLCAGYAQSSALLVTVVHGYPATWSAGLLATAAAATASLLTWRTIGPRPSSTLLRSGFAVAVAAALAAVGLAVTPGAASGVPHHQHEGAPRTVGEPTRRFTLTAATTTVSVGSQRVAAWAFNGQVPGPAITATVGDVLEVTLRNADISGGVTLHWHGYDVPSSEDGVPGLTQDAVMPGGEFVYRFRADQAGTYWYHTHAVSDVGVKMGLYGTLVVTSGPSPAGLDLTVPVHTLGGVPLPSTTSAQVTPGTPARFRLINTDSTPHRYALAGTPFQIAAIDGVDLLGPTPLSGVSLLLPAGGRYDLVFTMPATPVGLFVDGRRIFGESAASTAAWPVFDPLAYGSYQPPALTRFDRSFTLVLDRGLDFDGLLPRYAHTVNGQAAPDIPPQVVRLGDTVKFTIVNRSLAIHPWHLHGHHVLILSRNGQAPTGSPLWLDSFDVLPGDVWEVAFRADNPGIWANHCHNLAHAAAGMTLHLAYEGFTATSSTH